MLKQETSNKIKNYVDSFFEEIMYSSEVEDTKERIIEKLNEEYNSFLEKDKKNAFKDIVNKYPNIESMLESVDIDKNELYKWYNVEITSNYEEFKKVFKKERKHIYGTTILSIFSFVYMLDSILYFHESFLIFLLYL